MLECKSLGGLSQHKKRHYKAGGLNFINKSSLQGPSKIMLDQTKGNWTENEMHDQMGQPEGHQQSLASTGGVVQNEKSLAVSTCERIIGGQSTIINNFPNTEDVNGAANPIPPQTEEWSAQCNMADPVTWRAEDWNLLFPTEDPTAWRTQDWNLLFPTADPMTWRSEELGLSPITENPMAWRREEAWRTENLEMPSITTTDWGNWGMQFLVANPMAWRTEDWSAQVTTADLAWRTENWDMPFRIVDLMGMDGEAGYMPGSGFDGLETESWRTLGVEDQIRTYISDNQL
jgi:hypothetical protein